MKLLPRRPTVHNCLYSKVEQPQRTTRFFTMGSAAKSFWLAAAWRSTITIIKYGYMLEICYPFYTTVCDINSAWKNEHAD